MLPLLLATAALGLALVLVLRSRKGLWERLGVPYEAGLPFVGSYGNVVLQRVALQDVIENIYKKHADQPFVGFYDFRKPTLLLRDPEMARTIMTRDFSSFHDNAFDIDSKLDPLFARNPFFMKGEGWKTTRSQLVPAFSSGRLRSLLAPTAEVAAEMVAYVRAEGAAALPDGLDGKELSAKFTTEVVSSVALGVRANSFEDPNAEIRSMGRRLLQTDNFLVMVVFFIPIVAKILRIGVMPKDVDQFFRRLVGDAVNHREKNGIECNDFLQLLINLKKKYLEAGDNSYGTEEITAHAITFLTDGFETSATALAFLLHDLSGAPAEQRRLREELAALPAGDHEAVLRARYLDACLNETLRLHAPGAFLQKRCTSDYALQLPGGETATLPKGTSVVLPVLAWHHDPDLFPDPEAFRPERFLENGSAAKRGYLPFGDGPRQCIGMRFAQMQVKMGAAALVRAFELRRTPRSPRDPVEQDPKVFLTHPKGGIWVHFEPLA